MSWSTVQAHIRYDVGSWDTSYLAFGGQPTALSSGDQTTIEGYLQTLYRGSTAAAAAMEAIVTANGFIRIGDLPLGHGSDTGYYQDAPPTGTYDSFLVLHPGEMGNLYYISQDGRFVKDTPENIVAHELGHAYLERGSLTNLATDPAIGYGGGNASFDFLGPAASFANTVLDERSLSSNEISSYRSTLWNADDRITSDVTSYGALNGGNSASFTDGHHIDIGLLGLRGTDDLIDISSRTDNKALLAFGFSGDDQIKGAGGADYLYGGDGADTLSSGAGDDVLKGEAGADSLIGGDGADTLIGGPGADAYTCGDGDDLVMIGVDADVSADGGDGTDTLSLASYTSGASLALGSGAATLGGISIDHFEAYIGTAYGDTLSNAGVDGLAIDGADGADSILGGQSADALSGGDGNDTLSGGGGADSLARGEGDDEIGLAANASGYAYGYGQNGDDHLASDAAGPGFLDGGDGADTIDGNNQFDYLIGGQGDDRLNIIAGGVAYGEAGDDTYNIGLGVGTCGAALPQIWDYNGGDNHLLINGAAVTEFTFDSTDPLTGRAAQMGGFLRRFPFRGGPGDGRLEPA